MNNQQKAPGWSETPGRRQGKGVGAGTGWQGEDVINRVSVPLIRACWESSTPAPC